MIKKVVYFKFEMNKHKKIGHVYSEQNSPYLEYLHKFNQLQRIPSELSQLDSGVIFFDLFLLIKGFKIASRFEEQPRTFAHKFSNLKILMESIENYWNSQLQSEIQSKDIDIVEIGQYGSLSQIEKILDIFIKTAAKSQDNNIFIQRILDTSRETQQFLKKIIEQVLASQLKQSPRKEKEKRYIDRLLQLDHQNEKLQQIISTICDQKEELEMRLKSTSEILTEKTQQIVKLQTYINEETFTPQKKRSFAIPDTSERKDHQIDSLKQQIVELNCRHEKEVQELLAQIEKIAYKAHRYEKVKGELELSQSMVMSNRQLLEDTQRMEKTLSQFKADLMNKDNMITVMRQKLEKYEKKFIEMDKYELELKGELQRKNVHISELSSKIERISPRKSDSPHNLYLEFPEIVNTEADAYIETNKALREELERSRTALQRTAAELEQCKNELQPLMNCERENKKLRGLLIQEKSYKGEEIDVLVHVLYHLRKRVKEGPGFQQRALKPKNG